MAENPTPTPGEYKRDVGSGEQLPAGEATELNNALVEGDAVEESLQAQQIVQGEAAPLEEVEYAEDYDEPLYSPSSDMDNILFGPSEGFAKQRLRPANRPVPNSVVQSLPLLSTIVNDPSTPPVFKAAYRYYLRRLALEREARG